MFEYARQPWKAFYCVYAVLSVLVRLPYWSILAVLPATRPRRTWSVSRTLAIWSIDVLVKTWFKIGFPTDALIEGSDEDMGFVWVEPVDKDLVVGEIESMAERNGVRPERIPGYWHGKKSPEGKFGERAEPGEKILYYFHGGGYATGSAAEKENTVSSPYTASIPARSPQIFQRAFGINYRLSSAPPLEPKNPFPAALLDALAGYRYLVDDLGFEPKNVFLCGDSAGGHLALALTRYLIVADIPNLGVPGGNLLISPTADWGRTHDTGDPKCSAVENKKTDYVGEIMKNGYTGRCLVGKLPREELETNPWFSPASLKLKKTEGLFHGFPPTLINCGGAEQARDDKRTLRNRMVKDCGEEKVTYHEYPDGTHDFMLMSFFEPERTQALDDIHEWLVKVIKG